jgi:hypothetical protein
MFTGTVRRRTEPAAASRGGSNTELLRLLALREVESRGQPTALETANGIEPVARLVGLTPAGPALLHSLTDEGLLETSGGMPRRYRVTEAGHHEAERLAERLWPAFYGAMIGIGDRLAPATMRPRLRELGPPA